MKEIHTILKREHKLEGQRLLEDELTHDEIEFLARLMPKMLEQIQSGDLGRIIDYIGNYLLISLSEPEQERMRKIIAKRKPAEKADKELEKKVA